MSLSPDDFNHIANLVKTRSGIVLGPDKEYLLESRLLPIARKLNLKDLTELVQTMKKAPNPSLELEIVDSMTTNETFFFRDNKPFDQLKKVVLPEIIKRDSGSKRFRIWSAACSSGQEPYTILMCLMEESAKIMGWNYDIVATDICSKVIERAKEGVYSQFEVQRGLPVQLLLKYFTQKNENWQINEKLRSMVKFQQFNLMNGYSQMGKFDAVYLRNVLIYFNDETKSSILNKIAQNLNPGGFLFLGAAETVVMLSDKFKPYETERGLFIKV